jgi:DNA-binding response OmpR family regulator
MEHETAMGKNILIVEDEVDAGRLLHYHLRQKGYECRIAMDGRAALNAVFSKKPDLILLDLMLPTLNGLEICRLLKGAPATKNIPIIMVTAMATPDDVVRGFKLGADDYVTKPYEMRELLARVAALLRRERDNEEPVSVQTKS